MADLPKTTAAFEAGRANGLHTGAHLYVSQAGRTIVDAAFGESRPGVPMSPDSVILWFSAGKPLTAVAIAKFWESAQLDLDDQIAKFIPEFAARGKEAVTIRHLLTHTGGFRWVQWTPDWDEMIARISAAPLEPRWIPGRTAGYHTFTSWYILAEIVRRLDSLHRPYEKFIADEIFQPLGMTDSFLAMSPIQFREYGNRIAPMAVSNNAKLSAPSSTPKPAAQSAPPAESARGPARQLGQFYEMLLNHGSPLISPQTTEALTARHRAGIIDLTFKQTIDWGLGFIVNSAQHNPEVPYGFGEKASPRTFGHGGNQSSIAFADPESRLVLVLIFDAMPGEAAHQQRMRSTLAAINEDLESMGLRV